MSRMGKTEEDLNGLKVGFLKTVQPNQARIQDFEMGGEFL